MSGLGREAANTIIAQALDKARELEALPLSVVVLDAGGALLAMQRQDGASGFRFAVALGKAWACVANKASSRAIAARAQDNPNFMLSLAATAGGRFLPQAGGVLIKDPEGRLLGAAGASGGTADQDEAVCIHGISAAGFMPQPTR
jgi:uncharacterized protein GlcG (DUF336 family)